MKSVRDRKSLNYIFLLALVENGPYQFKVSCHYNSSRICYQRQSLSVSFSYLRFLFFREQKLKHVKLRFLNIKNKKIKIKNSKIKNKNKNI